MIPHFDVEQGTPEWLALRLGMPTASCFDKIVTPARGELSKQARAYAQQLVAETLLGMPLESCVGNLQWVEWGRLNEANAVQQYSFSTDTEVRTIGFITDDCGRVGCSPDRLLVGINGCLEVKCPAPQTHIGYLVDGPGADYRCQMQGLMMVGEFAFCDFYSFHPALPPVLVRTYRDEPYIVRMRDALEEFLDMRGAMLEQARAGGFFVPPADLREAA